MSAAAKVFATSEAKTTFGLADPFWGYMDPVAKTKASFAPLQTVVALRLCGREEAMASSGDHIARHAARLKRLAAVAKQPTHTPAANTPIEYLAIGHRMYYEKRWTDAREFYKTAAAKGKEALFSIHVFLLDFTSALKMANAGLHPNSGAAHLAYEAGKPCLKGAWILYEK